MVSREEYNIKHYDGFKTFPDSTLEKLKQSRQADQNYILQGTPNYRVLDNFMYR
jgi:hypothetical protein